MFPFCRPSFLGIFSFVAIYILTRMNFSLTICREWPLDSFKGKFLLFTLAPEAQNTTGILVVGDVYHYTLWLRKLRHSVSKIMRFC
jgi:hypothetical protein